MFQPTPPFLAKVRCVKSIRLDLFLLYTSLFQHPPFSAKVRCVKSIRLDLFLLYTSLFQHPPPFSAKVRCVKSIRLDLFLLYTSLFQHPPLSAKVRCVKSIRVDLFLLLRKGHFGNTHAVILKPEWGGGGRGCSKKSTFSRLQSKGLCTSYTTTLIKQVECGSNFDDEVKKWAEEAHQNNEKEKELAKEGGEMVEVYSRSRTDKGYTLVMDNVDMVVHARHPTRDNYGKDYHMVQMMAYQNRVTAFHLSNAPPTRSVDSVDSLEFLPTAQENLILRRDWMILAARMISQHIPALKQMMNVFPPEITHEHMAEMSKKIQSGR